MLSPRTVASATFPSTETHGWESLARTVVRFRSSTCRARTVAVIDLGKEVRPHCAHFGPDGLLYVSAELANAIYIVDTNTRSLVGEIPTGATHTHMFVISPDGRRIYTANNEPGSVSVLDLRARTLLATIPISKKVQRISISPDGRFVFTQDQEVPRIVVIDTATNAVVRSISLPRIAFSSVITKDGHWLLANSESGKLFVVDVASGALTKTFDTPRMFPFYPRQENSRCRQTAHTPM